MLLEQVIKAVHEVPIFGQNLVCPVIGRGATQKFFKEFIKITGIVEAYRERQIGNGERLRGRHH